jgi:streptogramin lyase
VLFEDRAGILWASSANSGLIRFDPSKKELKVYHHSSEDPHSLSSDKVNAIREDQHGRLWVGTQNGLNLLDRNSGTATIFTKDEGLPDNAIESILEDRRGYLWLGTHNGLSRFDPQTRTFRNYFESDGIAGNLLNPYGPGGSCQTPDGEMIFGSSSGVTVFNPERISENLHAPPVVLTDFLLFNEPVRQGKGSPLSSSIWATNAVTLTPRQSIFTSNSPHSVT